MKFIDRKNLSLLLESSQSGNPTILDSLDAYRKHGLCSYTGGSKVPTKAAYDVYKLRSGHPRGANKRVVSGYDYLLENLQSFDGKFVKIHSFGLPEATFAVFTNCAVSKLLGVVLSKERVSNRCVKRGRKEKESA